MNQRESTYPVMIVPNHWLEMKENIEIEKIRGLPVEPTMRGLNDNSGDVGVYGGCLLSIVGIILFFIGARSVNVDLVGMGIFGMILIFIGAIITNFSGNDSTSKFESDLKSYQSNFDLYVKKMEDYEKYLKRKMTEGQLLNSKNGVLQKHFIKQSAFKIKSDGYFKNSTIGISESYFLPYLKKKYSDKIKIGMCVEFSNGNEFYPDFIYVDTKRNLYLDIEVDEPYTFMSKQPIHFGDTDQTRDLSFTNSYWSIIRFSEEQVVNNPQGCVDTLISYIDYLNDDLDSIVTHVATHPRWTEEIAFAKIALKSREKLLNSASLI
jgi:hypothetical protein